MSGMILCDVNNIIRAVFVFNVSLYCESGTGSSVIWFTLPLHTLFTLMVK